MTPYRAHTHLELGLYVGSSSMSQAVAEAERAIALDPNNADSYARAGKRLQLFGGRTKKP